MIQLKNPRQSIEGNQVIPFVQQIDQEDDDIDFTDVFKELKDDEIVKDDLLVNCMDIFMFLNKNNDEYLDIKKVVDFRDVINIENDDQLDTIQSLFKKYPTGSIQFHEFVQIIKDLKINHCDASDRLYNSKFGGISSKILLPCKNCCFRSIRKYMVKKNLLNYKWTKEQDEDSKEKRQKRKNQGHTVMLGIKLYSSVRRISEKIINTILLAKLYYFSRNEENLFNKNFKIVTAWLFISLMSTILISYSSQLNIYLDRGYFTPQMLKGNCCTNLLPKIIFLTFIGSIYCIILEVLFILETFFSLIGLLCCHKGLAFFQTKFTRIYQNQMGGITSQQMKDLNDQRVLAQLMFQSFPDLIMKLLIITSVIDLKGFINANIINVILSLVISCLNMVSETYIIYSAACAFEEDMLPYSLQCMKARQGWVPFAHKIQNKKLRRAINYSEMKCYLPFITHKIGYYNMISYQFNDTSLQTLCEDILQAQNKLDLEKQKSVRRKSLSIQEQNISFHKQLTLHNQQYSESSQRGSQQVRGSVIQGFNINKSPSQISNLSPRQESIVAYQFGSQEREQSLFSENKEEQQDEETSKRRPSIIIAQFMQENKLYINIINIGESLNFVSMNMLIHFVDQVKDKQSFKLELRDVQWYTLLSNAISNGLLPKNPSQQYSRETIKDVNLLKACIDSEKENQWLLEGAFEKLLEHGCDPNIIDKETNLPLVIYAIKKKKSKAFNYLKDTFNNKVDWKKLISEIPKNELQNKSQDQKEEQPNQQSYIVKSNENNESWLKICVDNEPKKTALESILKIAASTSRMNQQIWLDKMNVTIDKRKNNNEQIPKTMEDRENFDTLIEEIKSLSLNHRHLIDQVIFKFTSKQDDSSEIDERDDDLDDSSEDDQEQTNKQTIDQKIEQNDKSSKNDKIRAQMIHVLDYGTHECLNKNENEDWFLKEFMNLLIEDGCDINIAVNKIPLILYALDTDKQEAFNIIHKKGIDWKKFIQNCKKDGTIKKSEEDISYKVIDQNEINWLKLIVDKEPAGLKSDGSDKGFFLGGLIEALLEDGYDPNSRVIIKKDVSSCSIIKYAEDNNKMYSFQLLKQYGSKYYKDEINLKNSQDTLLPIMDNQIRKKSLKFEIEEIPEQLPKAQNDENFKEITKEDLSQYDFNVTERLSDMGSIDHLLYNEDKETMLISTIRKLQKPQMNDTLSNLPTKKPDYKSMEIFDFIFELMAFLDLLTDILFLYILYNSEHTAWFTVALYSMISPYFVSYIPYLNYQLEKIYNNFRQNRYKNSTWSKSIMTIAITPLIVIYFCLIDLISQINGTILFPILQLLKIVTCGYIKTNITNESLDKLFMWITKMTLLEVKGFRRLRLISQLNFESLVQILLQVNILRYTKQKGIEQIADIDVNAIVISLLTAILHFILEIISLKLETEACKTSFWHYSMICYNGRLGWVPFIEKLECKDEKKPKDDRRIIFDYDNLDVKVCRKFDFVMEYEFTDDTALKIIKTLRNLPNYINEEERIEMNIGKSFDNVNFPILIDLLIETHNRVTLNIRDIDTVKMFKSYCKRDNNADREQEQNKDNENKKKKNREDDLNIDQKAIQELISYFDRIPLNTTEPNRKIRIEINQTILKEGNNVTSNLFIQFLKGAHQKADIKLTEGMDISDIFKEVTIDNISVIPPEQIASYWIYLFVQLSNDEEDTTNFQNINQNFPQMDDLLDDNQENIIDKISFHMICKMINDDNEMIIYHLYQTHGFLQKLGYKRQLYNYMYNHLNIDQFIKYAKYDQSLNEHHLVLLESDRKQLTQWVKKVLENKDEQLMLYQIAITRYFRHQVSQLTDLSLQQDVQQLNSQNIIKYPTDVDDLISYSLDNNKLIEIKGHHYGKNKREVVLQILNEKTEKNSKWIVQPIGISSYVKGWFHIILEKPIYIRGFGLRSADNQPNRDPHSFDFLAKIEGTDINQQEKRIYEGIDVTGFTRLYSKSDLLYDQRWQIKKFTLGERCCFIKEIKFLVTSLKSDVNDDWQSQNEYWMQIGQFLLYI